MLFRSTLTAIETKQDAVGTLNPDDDRSSVSHSVPVLDDNGDVIMVVTNNMNKEHSREWEQILKRERQVTERLRRELDNLRDQEEEPLIAHSPQMQKIYNVDLTVFPVLEVLEARNDNRVEEFIFPSTDNLKTVNLPASLTKITLTNKPNIKEINVQSMDEVREISINGSNNYGAVTFGIDKIYNLINS